MLISKVNLINEANIEIKISKKKTSTESIKFAFTLRPLYHYRSVEMQQKSNLLRKLITFNETNSFTTHTVRPETE
jgi:hypothetical protein